VIRCQPGDIVEVRGPGAGGYGLPVERDMAAVLQDVRCGFVSPQVARDSYGVAMVDGEVDLAATARLRAEMRTHATQHFDHGPARSAFERVWTPARYHLLTTFLADAPISWRHFLKQQVFAAVAADAQPPAVDAVLADIQPTALEAQMQAIFQNLQQRYPAMMNRSH
jgi:N-methylhydantoinase B